VRLTRLFVPFPLAGQDQVELDERSRQHAVQVLRLRAGDPLLLFDGQGGEYRAELTAAGRKAARARLLEFVDRDLESPLAITLCQGIARGERMDWVLQKATELGVARVTPVICERTQVRLDAERRERRMRHWRGILIHAAEQSGRTRVPELCPPVSLPELVGEPTQELSLILDPRAADRLAGLNAPEPARVRVLIGPEGGLSEAERATALAAGYRGIVLGPRILRTETAAVAALTALQLIWGDLG